MNTKSNRAAGFTLVEIMIVVAIIGLLASIAIPNFVRARENSQKNACINNLRQIDGAKQQWALENNKKYSATPNSAALTSYLGRGTSSAFPTCPSGSSSYTIGTIAVAPSCGNASLGHVLPP
jgi:prepilin-type N-terminal cleavage/methylation domain-containing protein